MGAYRDLTGAGIATRRAAELTGVSRATATRAVARGPMPAREPAPRTVVPANKLSELERTRVLHLLDCPQFVDKTPIQVFAVLLEEGRYVCSVSTMYRVLHENKQVKERRRLARHPSRAIPELVATGPGQVYSWDITKLPGPTKGAYFDAYVMIDIYSRYIVGAHVHAREEGVLAVEMMKEIFGIHGTPAVVHADRGTSMTSKTVAALLVDLGVIRSHSRPSVSNDNPYSEALFKTMKYLPEFPERFGCLQDARTFMAEFVQKYNHEHHHTGIGLHTPANVHYGHAEAVAKTRSETLAAARAAHPERFTTNTDPKILQLPGAAWINQPAETEHAGEKDAA